MIKKLAVVAVLVIASVLGMSGCSTPPSKDTQAIVVAELKSRGFDNPRYRADNDFLVQFGSCQLTIRQKGNGSLSWLAYPGNNDAWDFYVDGDAQLNAAWLRANLKGSAFAEAGKQAYDLTPCVK